MDTFDHVLHWKLKVGSHPFPGPYGGTCINEAAVVAAGFEYRPVRSPKDMPECFSRPICGLAMRLNDSADDQQRQRLIPYITRLACADTKGVELAREAYIAWRTRHDYIIPFGKGLKVLEGALAIGRQADPVGAEVVQSRMDAARTPKGEPFSKVKGWPSMEMEPEV